MLIKKSAYVNQTNNDGIGRVGKNHFEGRERIILDEEQRKVK